jgi:hypothetical protein
VAPRGSLRVEVGPRCKRLLVQALQLVHQAASGFVAFLASPVCVFKPAIDAPKSV